MEIVSEKNLFIKIKNLSKSSKTPFVVALDGRSGTGKSTLAKQIEKELEASVVICDDFYTGGTLDDWKSKTSKEKAENVIDWKRIRDEVLLPLKNGKVATWHPFNWAVGSGLSKKTITANPSKIIILDGAYSTRPELLPLIDQTVLIELQDEERRARLIEREGGTFVEAWHPVWDEAEDYYFIQVRPPSSFDFVIRKNL